MSAYDSMEPYEVCGEDLREAYVGLKRMRQVSAPNRKRIVLMAEHGVSWQSVSPHVTFDCGLM